MPKVSVIIPTYNRAHMIMEAINSVFVQTYKDFEIIVVDDGSTDNTREVLRELIEKDKVRYIYQENKGPAGAVNTGIKNSGGEYIAVLASDDLWVPIYLEVMVKVMENSPLYVGMVYANSYNFDVDKKMLKIRYKPNSLQSGNLLREFVFRKKHIYHGAALIRKECFDKIGLFDENLRRSEEREFYCRFFKRYQARAVQQPLAIIRLHGVKNPMPIDDFMNYEEQLHKYDKYIVEKILNDKDLRDKFFMFKQRILSRYNYIWGRAFHTRAEYKKAKQYLAKALKYNPLNWKAWPFLVLSVLRIGNRKKAEDIRRIESAVEGKDAGKRISTRVIR